MCEEPRGRAGGTKILGPDASTSVGPRLAASANAAFDDLSRASVCFNIVRSCRRALFLWQGFEENRPAKRSAQSLSRPSILTEKPQAARLLSKPNPIGARRSRTSQAQANDENLLPGHCAGQWHAGSRRRGHQAKRHSCRQGRRSMPGREGQELALRRRSEDGAEAADPRPRRRLRLARARRAEVIHGALCRLRHRPFHLDGAARVGEAKRPTGACAR